jgi:hypothetical protein
MQLVGHPLIMLAGLCIDRVVRTVRIIARALEKDIAKSSKGCR